MQQTRRRIYGLHPLQQQRPVGRATMTQDEIQKFLAVYEELNRTEGIVQFYRRKLQRLYQELPEVTVETVQEGKIICDQNKYKQIVTVPACLKKELVNYARKNGILSGPIFQTRDGRPMHRTYVSAAIRNLCEEAKVPREKGNPKSLRKLYLSTRTGLEINVALLVDQAMERMLEQEQFTVGWDEE